MTELDRASLERVLPSAPESPGWDDVLNRSWRRRAHRRRRIAVFAAATLAVVVAAASALGTVRDLFLGTTVNSKIGFFSLREGGYRAYVMNPDGSGQRKLKGGFDGDGVPRWSPDGSRIVFEHGGGRDVNDVDLYVANADGSGRRRLTQDPAADSVFPDPWSPDGRRIVFQRWSVHDEGGTVPSSAQDVYVIDVDGSRERNLTNDGQSGAPSWSPDGRMIAFHRDRAIHVMKADGSAQERLTRNRGDLPLWSPDGRKIAFLRHGDVNRGGPSPAYIYVVNADGSAPRRLTRMAQVNHSLPAWSPDGRRILFVSERDGNFEIYVINADGSGRRNLTRHPGHDSDPSWSPDGRQVVFVSKRDGNFEVYVMNADGSDQRNLTRNPATDRAPVWSPGRAPGG